MRTRTTRPVPTRLEAVRRRFERWRRTRKGHSRIPAPLWTAAVKLAEAYGLCRTARTLGLDYSALKRHVASAGPGDSPGARMAGAKTTRARTAAQETASAFVELLPSERAGSPECIVELEDPRGAKMRIHLTGRQSLEVVTAVSRVLFGAGS